MPNIDYVKRVHIVSQLQDASIGWKVMIYDADTGEPVDHICRAVITLDARELNVVELFYYQYDEHGNRLTDATGNFILNKIYRNFPDVDVYALEVRRNAE